MRKVTLFTIVLFVINFSFLNAQINEGKILFGVSSSLGLFGSGSDLMSLGYSSVKYKSDADGFEESDPDKSISLNILPKVGYCAADNVVAGFDIALARTTDKDGDGNYKFTRTILSVGPFVRYYIPLSMASPFVEISGSLGRVKTKSDYENNMYQDDEEYKSGLISIGCGVGMAVPLGESVTFDVLAGYNRLRVKAKEDNEDNYRSVAGTLGLKFGFTVLLDAY